MNWLWKHNIERVQDLFITTILGALTLGVVAGVLALIVVMVKAL